MSTSASNLVSIKRKGLAVIRPSPSIEMLPQPRLGVLRAQLLRWYALNRRALPWRRSRNSYRIWVAEVMLQQTRIAVVIPAYRRFIREFPTLTSLARAGEDAVLSAWSGLGYYSRARALRRAAQILHNSGARRFPLQLAAALALPGVGKYTAAAVLSMAYDQPFAAVDGNVVRVLSRLRCLALPDARGEPHATLAQQLLPPTGAGDWNQAIMELGETVCLPAAPACAVCPWQQLCEAHRHGLVAAFPPPRRRRRREQVAVHMTMVRDSHGRYLLERGAFAYLPHLWLPPLRASAPDKRRQPIAELRHAILHRDFRVHLYERRVTAAGAKSCLRQVPAARVERCWFDAAQLANIGRSSLLTKALKIQNANDAKIKTQKSKRSS